MTQVEIEEFTAKIQWTTEPLCLASAQVSMLITTQGGQLPVYPLALTLYSNELCYHEALYHFESWVDTRTDRQLRMLFVDVQDGAPWKGFLYTCIDLDDLGKQFRNDYVDVALCQHCNAYRVYIHQDAERQPSSTRSHCELCAKREHDLTDEDSPSKRLH